MGQVLDEETESHEELEREHRADKRELESSVSDILEEASVYTVHGHRGARSSVLEQVVEDQIETVFGSSRKTLSRPLVEVDDAKAMAQFFRGNEEWPLSDADAALLCVDTNSREMVDTGWCHDFIEKYASQKAVDVETLLQQTRTANGDYRGTPRESIAALLITLATSNKTVALKQDTDYVTDPAEIGRQVRTKGGLTSLQIRFDVEVPDQKTVNNLVAAVLAEEPTGDGSDEWLAELGEWVAENSATVKRTLKGLSREFGVSLDAFEATIEPALAGEEISTSDLDTGDELETTLEEAETFADARQLLGIEEDGTTLWEQFADKLDTMTTLYPTASITTRMETTAESDSVPSVATVESRIQDAEDHRVDELSSQYHRITGDRISTSDPVEVCDDLTAWLQSNEESVRSILDEATMEFDDIVLDDLEAVFETAWEGGSLSEEELIDATVEQQAETYERVRELFVPTNGESLWSQLQDAGERLRDEYPDSPTTETVETALSSSRPPTEQRVRQLIEQAKDPKQPGADDDAWAKLQAVAEGLSQELPYADVTDEVTEVVDTDDRPSEERVNDLLSESETVLERIREVQGRLDELDDGSIVLIEERTESLHN